MSQQEEEASPALKVKKSNSAIEEDSEKDSETFEDAVDTNSARSLTNRTPSGAKRRTSTAAGSDTKPAVEPTKAPAGTPLADAKKIEETKTTNSPPSRPLSRTSNLDVVNLDDDAVISSARQRKPQEEAKDIAPPAAAKDHLPKEKTTTTSRTLSLSSFTQALPSMPWSPPAESPGKSPIPSPSALPMQSGSQSNPAAPTRKLTSAFTWLSRNASKEKESSVSPPIAPQYSPRRNTASSIATITSNPEMMLSRLDEEGGSSHGTDGGPRARNSLKDRFKMVRMREEAGIVTQPTNEDDMLGGTIASLVGRSSSNLGLGMVSPTSPSGDVEGDKNLPPSSPIPPSPNPNLAPGTASGVSAGPSAMADSEVDWDLWQSVVYEGPAAVARTSAGELNKAIIAGIPHAIRGVIWQVLAQSKNEELETVYKDLVARGTEKDKDRNSNGTTVSASSNGNLSIHSEASVQSSASSVHSEQSGPNGIVSPSAAGEKNAEALQKAQAAAGAERKKKQKEDAAMLQKLEKAIKRDLGARTSYSKFAAAQGLQDGLFGVCKAYALFDEGVGYAQGMNFLVMPLLFNMTEEEAFCLLVRLMNHYHLRDLFIQDMPGLHMHLYQFERLLEDLEPALYCHLHRRGISPHLYATQWFLTLFAYRFPLQLVLRIYDLIFSEGLSAILRFGIVLMQKNATTLLGMSDMQQLTTFLKDKVFDVYIDKDPSAGSILENGFFGSSSSTIDKEVYRADQLVRDACEVRITPETLKAYTAEWEEKRRAEKEHEAELDGLKVMNASLTIKVRKLEDRIEACDTEQAAMATELVHTKVENEELKDENESLKGQVRELRIVIEKQPEEIEEAWKLERDDLMKRNEKVHEENQRLEQELTALEEQLVRTKMQYAEINSQHETLTRKWTDLKRQFT